MNNVMTSFESDMITSPMLCNKALVFGESSIGFMPLFEFYPKTRALPPDTGDVIVSLLHDDASWAIWGWAFLGGCNPSDMAVLHRWWSREFQLHT